MPNSTLHQTGPPFRTISDDGSLGRPAVELARSTARIMQSVDRQASRLLAREVVQVNARFGSCETRRPLAAIAAAAQRQPVTLQLVDATDGTTRHRPCGLEVDGFRRAARVERPGATPALPRSKHPFDSHPGPSGVHPCPLHRLQVVCRTRGPGGRGRREGRRREGQEQDCAAHGGTPRACENLTAGRHESKRAGVTAQFTS